VDIYNRRIYILGVYGFFCKYQNDNLVVLFCHRKGRLYIALIVFNGKSTQNDIYVINDI
jgi:hypothetical protein